MQSVYPHGVVTGQFTYCARKQEKVPLPTQFSNRYAHPSGNVSKSDIKEYLVVDPAEPRFQGKLPHIEKYAFSLSNNFHEQGKIMKILALETCFGAEMSHVMFGYRFCH